MISFMYSLDFCNTNCVYFIAGLLMNYAGAYAIIMACVCKYIS